MSLKLDSRKEIPAIPAGLLERVAAMVVACLLGATILYGVGFAQPEMLHNAAHDTRHAFTFPCH